MARPRGHGRAAVPPADRVVQRPRLRARAPRPPPLVGALSPEALAGVVARRVEGLVPAAREDGVAVRVGIDAAVGEEGAGVADRVAGALGARGVATARVRAGDFLHRRSVRLEHGPDDADAAYERWVDHGALRREVLDPLGDPAAMRWLPRLWDAAADRPFRDAPRVAVPGLVLVADGPYLLRWELAGAFDAVVHLALTPAALRRRFPESGDPRPDAWARYLEECDPAARADLVVRHDHPDRPAVPGA